MGFKAISDLSADTTVALGGKNKQTGKNNPTSIEGYYLGSRQVESKKAKSGKAYIYYFQTPKGNVGVWGKTDLDRKMQTATPGHMLRVTQSGMANTPNGEMYKYTVEFDADDTIEVTLTNNTSDDSRNAQSSTGGYFGDSSENDEDEDATSEDDIPAARTLQSTGVNAQERAAKVQALLSKNKR